MLDRLFPRQADNRFEGNRAALWLLGLLVALKLVMSVNSIGNTEAVAAGADGIPLASYGAGAAQTVLMLFALMSLGHLAMALVALAVLIRYRTLVPSIFLLFLGEHLARRLIVQSHAVARTESGPVGWYVFFGFLALTALGLALSLIHQRRSDATLSEREV
jgi:hypothetical protein